jgi:hypothetical protein
MGETGVTDQQPERSWLVNNLKIRTDSDILVAMTPEGIKLNAQVMIKNLRTRPGHAREVPAAHGRAKEDGAEG